MIEQWVVDQLNSLQSEKPSSSPTELQFEQFRQLWNDDKANRPAEIGYSEGNL